MSRTLLTPYRIEIAVNAGVDHFRTALPSLSGENCGCLSSSVRREPRASRRWVESVQVETKLGERRQLAVLSESALDQLAATLLHRLEFER